MIAPALRSRSEPATSSARTACTRGSPARSAPRSTRPARPAAQPSTPTTQAGRGPGIEFFVAARSLAGVFPTHDGRTGTFVFDADHPAVLVGQDHGPTPVEFVLHALAACLTAGLANIAARRVRLTQVRSTVTGDIDLNGTLGLNPDVRNGYQQLTVRFTIKGDAPADKLRELVAQSQARSAVSDIITNRVPVTIEVDTR